MWRTVAGWRLTRDRTAACYHSGHRGQPSTGTAPAKQGTKAFGTFSDLAQAAVHFRQDRRLWYASMQFEAKSACWRITFGDLAECAERRTCRCHALCPILGRMWRRVADGMAPRAQCYSIQHDRPRGVRRRRFALPCTDSGGRRWRND